MLNKNVSRYGAYGILRKTVYDSKNGEVYSDKFGNNWTCDHDRRVWVDDYGNSTGYHPEDIASSGNPLVSPDSQLWEFNGCSWVSNTGDTQQHYPGSPKLSSSGKKSIRKPRFKCQNTKYLRIVMSRLERQSNCPGFGNARTVRTFLTL